MGNVGVDMSTGVGGNDIHAIDGSDSTIEVVGGGADMACSLVMSMSGVNSENSISSGGVNSLGNGNVSVN